MLSWLEGSWQVWAGPLAILSSWCLGPRFEFLIAIPMLVVKGPHLENHRNSNLSGLLHGGLVLPHLEDLCASTVLPSAELIIRSSLLTSEPQVSYL